MSLAAAAVEEGKALLIAANKVDLLKPKQRKEFVQVTAFIPGLLYVETQCLPHVLEPWHMIHRLRPCLCYARQSALVRLACVVIACLNDLAPHDIHSHPT